MIAFGNVGRPVTDGVKCAMMRSSIVSGAIILCHRQVDRGRLLLPDKALSCSLARLVKIASTFAMLWSE